MSEATQDARAHDFCKVLHDEGWLAFRVRSAFVLALQAGSQPRLIYVTTGIKPFSRFRGSERRRLLAQAEKAGAHPQVVWWPADGHPQRFNRELWP